MAGLLMRWRFFWSRRSARRSVAALVLALLALFAVVYLALPQDGRLLVDDSFSSAIQGIGSLGLGMGLGAGAALCMALSLVLIFVPSYRRHTYLATSPSIIPQVSVYLDAENQLSAAAVRPFMNFLIKYLDGRRADLLYFLDASQAAKGDLYKTLYRFGFRPVDVPHDPTGQGAVKEAVDKELALHAYERALLGPPEQEFIIVTGDADFVHLVYRLAALGHRVQVWASPIREAYRTLGTYLDVGVLDLTQILTEREAERDKVGRKGLEKPGRPSKVYPVPPARRPTTVEHAEGASPPLEAAGASASDDTAQDVLDLSGERAYYRAIRATLKGYDKLGPGRKGLDRKKSDFRSMLGGQFAPQMAEVGYSAGNWIDCWIDHLIAAGIFQADTSSPLLKRGPSDADEAAVRMFAMAQAAAAAAAQLAARRSDGLVRMQEVAVALASAAGDSSDDAAAPLLDLLRTSGPRRSVHARYFVRGARALGLISFEEVEDTLDVIRHVSSPGETQAPADSEQAGEDESKQQAPIDESHGAPEG